MAVGSTLTITELTGPENVLELTGRSLPYKGLPFEGKMRAEFTRYPGNPIATVQMLGNDEGSSMIHGVWKDRFVSPEILDDNENVIGLTTPAGAAKFNGLTLENSLAIVGAVDGFRRRGQLLEFAWDVLIRQGILTRFKHTWDRKEVVDWEMEFEWISQGEPLQPVAFVVPPNPADIADQLISTLQAIQAAILAPFQIVQNISSMVSNAANSLSDAVEVVSSTATKLNQLVLSPLDAAKQTMAALTTIGAEAQTIESAVTSVPAQALPVSENISTVSVGQTLQAAQWSRNLRIQTRAMRYYAARTAQTVKSTSVSQTLLASFTARAGLDLRTVANQYYGTPDEWRTISTFNGLQGSQVPVAQTLLVPRLSSTSGSSLTSTQSGQVSIFGSNS